MRPPNVDHGVPSGRRGQDPATAGKRQGTAANHSHRRGPDGEDGGLRTAGGGLRTDGGGNLHAAITDEYLDEYTVPGGARSSVVKARTTDEQHEQIAFVVQHVIPLCR